MQRVDIGVADVGDFHVPAEVRPDVALERARIGELRTRAFARQVLGLKAVGELGHGRCRLGLLEVAERVFADINIPAQLLCARARGAGGPVGIGADRVAPLPPGAADVILQHEAAGAAGGNPDSESAECGIPVDPVARGRPRQPLHDDIAQRRAPGRQCRHRADALERGRGGGAFCGRPRPINQCLDLRCLRTPASHSVLPRGGAMSLRLLPGNVHHVGCVV
jgi:hypothetical protein